MSYVPSSSNLIISPVSRTNSAFGFPHCASPAVRSSSSSSSPLPSSPRSNKRIIDLELNDYIASGSFGSVHFAQCLQYGKCAAKLIPLSFIREHKLESYIQREIELAKSLRHPNIVRTFDSTIVNFDKMFIEKYPHADRDPNTQGECLAILMEQVSGGDVFEKVLKTRRLDQNLARRLFQQLVSALIHLHSHNYIHRDLKAENLLLTNTHGTPELKLCDFGLARKVVSDTHFDEATGEQKVVLLRTLAGSLDYQAPEVLREDTGEGGGGGYVGFTCDVWSSGVVLYFMLSGQFPFHAETDDEVTRKIFAGKLDLSSAAGLPPSAAELICGMLQVDIEKRMTFHEVVQHPWFQLGLTKKALEDLEMKSRQIYHAERFSPKNFALVVVSEYVETNHQQGGGGDDDKKFFCSDRIVESTVGDGNDHEGDEDEEENEENDEEVEGEDEANEGRVVNPSQDDGDEKLAVAAVNHGDIVVVDTTSEVLLRERTETCSTAAATTAATTHPVRNKTPSFTRVNDFLDPESTPPIVVSHVLDDDHNADANNGQDETERSQVTDNRERGNSSSMHSDNNQQGVHEPQERPVSRFHMYSDEDDDDDDDDDDETKDEIEENEQDEGKAKQTTMDELNESQPSLATAKKLQGPVPRNEVEVEEPQPENSQNEIEERDRKIEIFGSSPPPPPPSSLSHLVDETESNQSEHEDVPQKHRSSSLSIVEELDTPPRPDQEQAKEKTEDEDDDKGNEVDEADETPEDEPKQEQHQQRQHEDEEKSSIDTKSASQPSSSHRSPMSSSLTENVAPSPKQQPQQSNEKVTEAEGLNSCADQLHDEPEKIDAEGEIREKIAPDNDNENEVEKGLDTPPLHRQPPPAPSLPDCVHQSLSPSTQVVNIAIDNDNLQLLQSVAHSYQTRKFLGHCNSLLRRQEPSSRLQISHSESDDVLFSLAPNEIHSRQLLLRIQIQLNEAEQTGLSVAFRRLIVEGEHGIECVERSRQEILSAFPHLYTHSLQFEEAVQRHCSVEISQEVHFVEALDEPRARLVLEEELFERQLKVNLHNNANEFLRVQKIVESTWAIEKLEREKLGAIQRFWLDQIYTDFISAELRLCEHRWANERAFLMVGFTEQVSEDENDDELDDLNYRFDDREAASSRRTTIVTTEKGIDNENHSSTNTNNNNNSQSYFLGLHQLVSDFYIDGLMNTACTEYFCNELESEIRSEHEKEEEQEWELYIAGPTRGMSYDFFSALMAHGDIVVQSQTATADDFSMNSSASTSDENSNNIYDDDDDDNNDRNNKNNNHNHNNSNYYNRNSNIIVPQKPTTATAAATTRAIPKKRSFDSGTNQQQQQADPAQQSSSSSPRKRTKPVLAVATDMQRISIECQEMRERVEFLIEAPRRSRTEMQWKRILVKEIIPARDLGIIQLEEIEKRRQIQQQTRELHAYTLSDAALASCEQFGMRELFANRFFSQVMISSVLVNVETSMRKILVAEIEADDPMKRFRLEHQERKARESLIAEMEVGFVGAFLLARRFELRDRLWEHHQRTEWVKLADAELLEKDCVEMFLALRVVQGAGRALRVRRKLGEARSILRCAALRLQRVGRGWLARSRLIAQAIHERERERLTVYESRSRHTGLATEAAERRRLEFFIAASLSKFWHICGVREQVKGKKARDRLAEVKRREVEDRLVRPMRENNHNNDDEGNNKTNSNHYNGFGRINFSQHASRNDVDDDARVLNDEDASSDSQNDINEEIVFMHNQAEVNENRFNNRNDENSSCGLHLRAQQQQRPQSATPKPPPPQQQQQQQQQQQIQPGSRFFAPARPSSSSSSSSSTLSSSASARRPHSYQRLNVTANTQQHQPRPPSITRTTTTATAKPRDFPKFSDASCSFYEPSKTPASPPTFVPQSSSPPLSNKKNASADDRTSKGGKNNSSSADNGDRQQQKRRLEGSTKPEWRCASLYPSSKALPPWMGAAWGKNGAAQMF